MYNHQNHHKAIQISHTLFELDPLNEQALYYAVNAFLALKLENKAKEIYRNFSITFSEMMGEPFPDGYEELLK